MLQEDHVIDSSLHFSFIVIRLIVFFDMASLVRLEDKYNKCQALSNLWSPKEWFTEYDL